MNVRTLLVCGTMLALVACTSAPIHNVPPTPVVTGSGKPATVEQVRSAIVRAGNGLGWQMTPADPGLVTGRIALRGHTAVIDVKYSPSDYSITYKDSTNLDYNGKDIHKNYNGWIENLNRDIRANLMSL
jgi:hypothetical protein